MDAFMHLNTYKMNNENKQKLEDCNNWNKKHFLMSALPFEY